VIKYKPGYNPASHNNKPKLSVVACEITLTTEQWAIASQLGEGNKSLGMRRAIDLVVSLGATDSDKLFSRLPAIGKAKLAIQLLLDCEDSDRKNAIALAESVLIDLEDLEIEIQDRLVAAANWESFWDDADYIISVERINEKFQPPGLTLDPPFRGIRSKLNGF
jgi:hypothetical protein